MAASPHQSVYILGISCWYHDAAACLIQDGRIVAAAQEERFTRHKHDPGFPEQAIAYCLQEAGITAKNLDLVAFYEKPFLKFERLLETYLGCAPKGWRSFTTAMPLWLKQKLWIPDLLEKALGCEAPILFPEHHASHAASAFYPSPFERAAFITTDGVGEWATTSYGVGDGNRLQIQAELHFPHSLGLLYSAFTYFTGFQVNSGEYKLMGLAPYGEPRYATLIRDHLIDIKEDGSFRLNMDYFTYPHALRMTGKKFEQLFGGPARQPETPLTRRDMDLARSIQEVTEDVMLRIVRHVHRMTGETKLCLAGGVALNCVANGRILREGPFEQLWVQPAAGDSGGALGAALMAWHGYRRQPRTVYASDSMQGSLLGPAFSASTIRAFLDHKAIPYEYYEDEDALLGRVADLLAAQRVVGWFQGRMEFGPRALGSRSILADPRGHDMQRILNTKIKFRESFRPFAPSVRADKARDYFDLDGSSPYMTLVASVHGATATGEGLERLRTIDSPIPAVTHVDGSARIQTVHPETMPLYYRLLEAFEARSGCPVLVNTSFNVRGEPIVCSPHDAHRCFRRTHMDVLALGPFVITKEMFPDAQAAAWTGEHVKDAYGLD